MKNRAARTALPLCLAGAATLFLCPDISWAQAAFEAAGQSQLPGIPAEELRETASLFTAIVKVVGSLTLVVALIFLAVTLAKRLGLGGVALRSSSLINVIDTRMIAPKKYIAVVKLVDEFVAVGVTDQHISMLTRLEQNPALEAAAAGSVGASSGAAASFASLLGKATGTLHKKAD